MPHRGENIYRRKDGRWEGRCVTGHAENGRATFRYFYGRSYREVKEKLRNQNTQKQAATQPQLHYSDILDAWLQSKRLSVKESSYGKYRHTVGCYIRPYLGDCRACDLTTELVADYVQNLLHNGRQDGQGLAPKTVQDILVIVKDTVSFAAAQGFRLPCRLERMSVKQKTTEMRVFTQEEQRKLTAFLFDSPDTYKFAVLLCLYTGLRIGEVCALRWSCIDMGRQVLRVQATVQRVRDAEPGGGTKTKMLFAEPKSKCSIQHYTDDSAVETTFKNGTISDFGRTDSGEKTLTLFSQNACVVAYKDADGNYVRLKALANKDGSYRYAISGGVSEVTVAVKGDLDSDGQLTAKEARQLLTASTNASTLTKLQYLCADLDGNGVISAREARILLKASTGNAAIDW